MKKVALAAILLAAAALALLLFASTPAGISFKDDPKVIGQATPVRVEVASPNGLRRFGAFLQQGEARFPVYESAVPARRWLFWAKSEPAREIGFSAGKKQAAGLREGKAQLVLEAVANDFRGATTRVVRDVEVRLQPPSITADGHQHYINQGGSELVAFTVSGYWTEAGVRVGNYTFRSFPLPGKGPNERFAFFAFPWDVPSETVPILFARNPSGAEATARFWTKVFPRKFRARDLPLDDAFLTKVTTEIDRGGSGDPLARFLRINGPLRRENNQALAALRTKTEQRVLWSGPFLQLGNSKVESQFADRRSYIYQGKKVDEQMHLGFDLSVTKNVAVAASNSGTVIHAGELGIYGKCIVIDHGYGLQSIYAHLSEISVKPGDVVQKAQTLGKSGATGLAGGDHLHYSMQVDGVQVNPVEWWDEHWIKDRILTKLSPPPAQ